MHDESNAALPVRGLMLDPARHIERHQFYFGLLPHLKRWGLNTLWWHFVDNEGVALEVESHPEVSAPFAFSKDAMRRFLQQAAHLGIDVVPEVETLGHARYLTDLPRYSHLRDGTHRVMNAICPSQAETVEIMGDIVREVAELFPSPYLHAGLDEADFSGCERCAERGAGKPRWWVFAEHVKAIHSIVTGCGKKMIMWADHVEHDPDLLDVIPRDVVLCHWQYREVNEAAIRRSLDAGFKVITAPTMCSFGNMIQPADHNFDTMDEMVETTVRLVGDGALGMVNTWWAPQRGIRDAYLPAIAYTGEITQKGQGVDRVESLRRFVAEHFGIDDPETGAALWRMHELAVHLKDLDSLLCHSMAGLHRLVSRAGSREFRDCADMVSECAGTLRSSVGSATEHAEALGACVLAAELVDVCMANGLRLHQAADAYEKAAEKIGGGWTRQDIADDLAAAFEWTRKAAAQMAGLTSRLETEWTRTRYTDYPDDYLQRDTVQALERQMLLERVQNCSAFLTGLSSAFEAAVKGFREDGVFPGTFA